MTAVATTSSTRAAALERYRRDTDLPLMVLAVAVIPLVLVEHFGDLQPRAKSGLEWTYGLIWAAFLVDYIVRLVLADDRRAYVRQEWLAAALVVLTFPAPLNPFEILRSARALRLLRFVRFGAITTRGAQRIVKLPRGANSQLGVGLATFLMLALISAELVLAVEEGQPGSKINTMGDSVWWAVSTVTTNGYGDVIPMTLLGRVMAFVLMLAGVALVAVVVSNFGARLKESVERKLVDAAMSREEAALDGIVRQLGAINDRLTRIEAISNAPRPTDRDPGPS